MGRKLFLAQALLFWVFFRAWSQDPVFSQFYSAPLQLNPAFAGVAEAPRITLNYRNQWPAWPNAYRTYALSFEQPLPFLQSGFGVSALADDAGNGIYRTLAFHAVYSYHLQISESYFLKFGVEGGVLQSRVDWDQLVFGDQVDPIEGYGAPGSPATPSEENRPTGLRNHAVDFGTGLLFHSQSVYAGVSVRHLNRPDESLLNANDNLRIGRPMRLSFHVGWEIGFAQGNNLKYPAFISPNLMLIRQADFTQINAGAYLGYNLFFGGLWYRHSGGNPDAFIGLVGVREGPLRFGYSYDMTMSALGPIRTGGTHEVSLTVNFAESRAFQRRKKASRYNNCFNMFR